jgi:transposase InsO family protein
MRVSRSSYYQYLKQQQTPNGSQQRKLEALVKSIHKASKESYGSRRISEALQGHGYPVGRYQARSLMRKLNLVAKSNKRFKVTTDSNHNHPVAPNLLNRQFQVDRPDTVWASDITYLWTHQGWLYVAVVLDLFSRKVVGWSIDRRMTSELVKKALNMAVMYRQPSKGLLHHSDRGSQYASHAYQEELRKHGMVCSMSRKGNCWDNAVVERFFRSLKTEQTNHYRYASREAARRDVVDYILMFYNSQRLHSTLGYRSPADFEAEYQQLQNVA